MAVWGAILLGAAWRRPDWKVVPEAVNGSIFLLSLVMCASLMPVERLPAASWPTALGLGFVSAVFDNIPLTALALKQGGYDWGFLAYAVGFGGSMIWFGSSAGVALSNLFPEAKSVALWLKHSWYVAVAYVVGFFVLLLVHDWHPNDPHKPQLRPKLIPTSPSGPRAPRFSSGAKGSSRVRKDAIRRYHLLMERRIAHLDMDAFYASVELLRYPQLKGLAVVIGGSRRRKSPPREGEQDFARLRDYVGRGVATTATYEARALGVHSGMGLMKAAVLAPEAILLPADFDAYRLYSRRFKAAVAEIAPHIEDRGIDEIYIDLTEVPGETRFLAQRIKDNVRSATGLSCSIGITHNKLLAKIASELQKPDGLTVLTHADLATRIWPLPARKINGVGPRASSKLEALGIRTIGELAQARSDELIAAFW